MEVEWSNDKLRSLIELVHHHENLWDQANAYFRDRDKRNITWEEISKALGVSRKSAETKFITLRSQFSRERRRIVTGREEEQQLASKWRWFEPLKFLWNTKRARDWAPRPARDPRDPRDTRDTEPDFIKPEVDCESLSSYPGCVALDDYDADPISPSTSPADNSAPETSASWQRPSDHEPPVSQQRSRNTSFALDQPIPKRTAGEDEFDTYGQYVASEMRNANNLRATIRAKYHINRILTEMRFGRYD